MKTVIIVFFFCVFNMPLYSTNSAGLSITWNGTAYEVVMNVVTCDMGCDPLNLGASQVSIVLPTVLDPSSISITCVSPCSSNTWSKSFIESPSEDPTHDFVAFANGGGSMGTVSGNSDITLFTFTISGGCNEEIRLFDNSTDPAEIGGSDFRNTLFNIPNGEFYNGNNVDAVDCLVLPTELINFYLTINDHSIDLSWQSAQEINFSGYELQRSTDGKNFDYLTWVKGLGGHEAHSYEYTDRSVRPDITYYYRLKMIDNDGAFEYSPIRSAVIRGPDDQLHVYPNPARDQLTLSIHSDLPGSFRCLLFDEIGRAVLDRAFLLQEGANEWTLDVRPLSGGVYELLAEMPDRVIRKRLLILQTQR